MTGTLLVLIGSGETSPTMVTVHRDLVTGTGVREPEAVLLATPYAFQVNAAAVSARAQRYFARSVGLPVLVAAGTSSDAGPAYAPPMLPDEPDCSAAIRRADWVFAGPGNPSYALAHWRAGQVGAALRERILAGRGVTVLASAAAATAGSHTVPVYEIYKAGSAPGWLDGLDVLGPLGLDAAVIPHYDNAEGRDYDTRYCYLGAARLLAMEADLPRNVGVLGIDEHTALLIDQDRCLVTVRGRGGVTVRRDGASTVLPAGHSCSLATLRALLHGTPAVSPSRSPSPEVPGIPAASPDVSATPADVSAASPDVSARGGWPAPLPQLMATARADFDRAVATGDVDRAVAAMLALEDAIAAWDADTDEDQGTEQARAILRDMITRLGAMATVAKASQSAQAGRLDHAAGPLLALRTALRAEGRYDQADAIRAALAEAGLHIQDTPDGPRTTTAE